MSSFKFNKNFLHMDVLCAKRYLNFTLAGIGSDLFVYSSDGSLLWSQQIFLGERIHSICLKSNLILLKGGRKLCLMKFKESSGEWLCEIVAKIQCHDWVQDFIILENQMTGLVTAHNYFECWDLDKRKQLSGCSSEEKCILYSCKIIGDSLENLIIFAGTVFGDVVIWAPNLKDQTLQRLKGHNGAVFSIEVKPQQKLLTTTSDDRSLKVWSISSPKSLAHPTDWKHSSIQLLHTLFGHTARVWRSLILDNYYLTVGEDSQLVVWSSDGRMIKTLSLHQESGIRALDYSNQLSVITTGGEDGGINGLSLNHLITENKPMEILNLSHSSTKVCYTQNGIVYCVNGKCVLVSELDEVVVYKSENFSSYCLLEVSTGGKYIIMGSIKGHLVIINSKTKTVLVEKEILHGRVYSIHWLDSVLVTCGPEGQLDLWELSDVLKHMGTKLLPNCKERWTTCGVVCNENLILGDRMGNVHIYKLHEGENPLKSFRKIHSHLGVTDISTVDGNLVSTGRDGTLKEFSDLNLSITSKLPMEWPWKIVKYKNDILILGFHSVSFIIWSMKNREVIASHNCGGGHRSCDYKINKNKLSFLYVKEKKVFVIKLILDQIIRIRSGFHGKEINCVKILQTEPVVMVSGSEDTTLRFSKIENSILNHVEVLKAHISSVRAIFACSTHKKLVSVGGKGQIIVWDFDVNSLKCQELVNHRLRKETRNWKSSTLSIDPEMRIMCVDVLKLKNEFIIATGCSDCQIRIFSHSEETEELRQLNAIPYTHCVLNVVFLKVDLRVLVSMGTDGKVVFWDVSDFSEVKGLKEFFLHQSGINSFQFEEMEFGKFILATGGDDNLISVGFVEITAGKISLRQVWKNNTTHSCQITGIKILKNFLLTTSIDQRITIWKWFWHENEFKIKFLNQHITAVPDIQGMDAAWLSNSSILVTVYGKGIEIYNVDVNEEKS